MDLYVYVEFDNFFLILLMFMYVILLYMSNALWKGCVLMKAVVDV